MKELMYVFKKNVTSEKELHQKHWSPEEGTNHCNKSFIEDESKEGGHCFISGKMEIIYLDTPASNGRGGYLF